MAAPEILTIGHSTHPIERLIGLLRTHRVALLADVRRFPASRRHPQFNSSALAAALEAAGIGYAWLGEALGGRRRPRAGCSQPGWHPAAFRGYADHMQTPQFAAGLKRLEALARERRVAIACAEADWRRCHRRLIADALSTRGWRVLHILPDGHLDGHALSPHALAAGQGSLLYPG